MSFLDNISLNPQGLSLIHTVINVQHIFVDPDNINTIQLGPKLLAGLLPYNFFEGFSYPFL